MRSINSPSNFNPLEERIVGSIPEGAKHVAVVGDGDGRLAREIRAKMGAEGKVYAVETRSALHKYLDDFPDFGKDPWDVPAFEAAVKAHGAFDAIVFYGLHEYWRGHMHRFQKLTGLVRPDGKVWVTFANLSALRFVEQQLPPIRVATDILGAPNRFWPHMDYASWVAAIGLFDVRIDAIWGLLDKPAFDYCQSVTQGAQVEWDLRGVKVIARSPAEVVQWGASYLGIQMTAHPTSASPAAGQTLGGVAHNPHLYQALVNPFPEADNEEGDLAWATTELAAVAANRKALRPSQLVELLLSQVDKRDEVRDVLVVGAGWGRDVLMLKTVCPQWNVVGIEPSESMRSLGRSLLKEEGLRVEGLTLGEKLPFKDKSFDIVITLGFMSKLYNHATVAVVRELIRVARKSVYHLEDARGPEQMLRLKQNSLTDVYSVCGQATEGKPLMVQDQFTGFVFHKVSL